jgi:hypothetical protein
MQDDPPQEDNLKAKWEKIYRDVCNDLEEPAQQDECLEIGWQRDAYYSDEKLIGHAEMLGTANDFDLDAEESSAEDPRQSADLASSQVGDSMFKKSAGPGDYSFFGEEVSADEQLENPQTDMPSSLLQIFFADDISFNAWQILALLCLVLLMLCGGIVVMDALCRIL